MRQVKRFVPLCTLKEKEFYIDILEDTKEKSYSAYLYHADYDVKLFMFSMPVRQQSLERFIEFVEAYFYIHKDLYEQDYMDK